MEVLIVPFIVRLALARVLGEEQQRAGVRHRVRPADVALRVRLAPTSLDIRRDDGICLQVLVALVEV